MEIRNAIIFKTQLGREDHGILTFMIFVKFGDGGGCGIGGYVLDERNKDTGERVFSAESMEAVSKILDTVGVDYWEDLKGKYIRVKENGWGSPIDEIGNVLEDKWFNLKEFFRQKEKEV